MTPFAIGMTWAEINAIWKGGVSSYLRDGANILDFAILALFWSYMVLTLISYLQVGVYSNLYDCIL